MSAELLEPPKAGEDCRSLHRYVTELVERTNALLNMSGTYEGRVRSAMGMGHLRIVGQAAELRVFTHGGDSLDSSDNRIMPTVTLVSSHNPSNFGETVTFTCFVPADATGTVTFIADGVTFGVVTVSGGVAVAQLSGMGSGTHVITAAYSGDYRYFPASVQLLQQVNALRPPVVQVAAQPNPAVKGIDFVVFLANVIGQDPIPPAPQITGDVAFYIDNSLFESEPLSFLSGQTWRATTADNPINYLDFGDHQILARYEGDQNYDPAWDTVTLRVLLAPNVVVTASPNPVPPGFDTTLVCTVSRPYGNTPQPTGQVQFSDQNGNIGSPVDLDQNGVARLTFSAGNTPTVFHITGKYLGDDNYAPTQSATFDLQVVDALVVGPLPSEIDVATLCQQTGSFAVWFDLYAPATRTNVYLYSGDQYGSPNGTTIVDILLPGGTGQTTLVATPSSMQGWIAINRFLRVYTQKVDTAVSSCTNQFVFGSGRWRIQFRDDPNGGGNIIPFFYNGQQVNFLDTRISYELQI